MACDMAETCQWWRSLLRAERFARRAETCPSNTSLMGGKPVIRWTLEAFLRIPLISNVQTVIGQGHEDLFAEATARLAICRRLSRAAITGRIRAALGVEACASAGPAKVLIHDAARPFHFSRSISNVIAELDHATPSFPACLWPTQ